MTDQEFLFATMAMAEYCTNVMCRLSPLSSLPSPPSLQHNSILVLIYVDTVMNQIEGIVRRRETKPGYNTSHNSRNNESKQDFYITSIIVIHFTLFM